jgi:MoxR-like ATPase
MEGISPVVPVVAVQESAVLPQCWQDFKDVISAGVDRVILFGAPGTGKTYGGLTLGVGDGGSFRLICTEDMTTAQVSGAFMPDADGFKFMEGSALRAWRGNGQVGGRLVVDEVDKASGDVFGELLNFLDSTDSSSFAHPETNEVFTPLSGFSAVMTSNIEHPDDLPMALRDRFPIAIEINAPHPSALLSLPTHLRTVANAVISSEPERRVSLRAFYAYNTLLNSGMTNERASVMAFGAQKAEAIIDAVRVGSLS